MAGWARCRNCHQPIWWGSAPFDSDRNWPYDDADEEVQHFDTCAAVDRVTDAEGKTHRVNTCRACKKRVWWQTTRNGKRRPMDTDGSQATDECHFDTCEGEPGARAREEERRRWETPSGVRGPSNVPYSVGLWLPDLELTWPCTTTDVTSAFRRLAMRYHPDTGGPTADAAAFIRCKLAYDRLKDLLGAAA